MPYLLQNKLYCLMKRKLKITLLFVLTLFVLSSCVVTSLHSLYKEDQLLFNEKFVGQWNDNDGNEWDITAFSGYNILGNIDTKKDSLNKKKPPKAFYLKMKDEKGTGNFILGLVQLGDNLFIDFYPDIYSKDEINNEFMSYHRLPVHSFGKINISDTLVQIKLLNSDWLSDYAESGDTLLDVQEVEIGNIITSSTEKIQRFLIQYADSTELFGDEIILKPKNNQ